MAFMFETCYILKITEYANNPDIIDINYAKDSWSGFKKNFNPKLKKQVL
jgi:homogentisate 1,2-dioxygenase